MASQLFTQLIVTNTLLSNSVLCQVLFQQMRLCFRFLVQLQSYCISRHSSIFVLGPVVIQPLLNASATSAISSSVISGGLKLIVLFSIMFPRFPFINLSPISSTRCGLKHTFIAVALLVFSQAAAWLINYSERLCSFQRVITSRARIGRDFLIEPLQPPALS